MKLTSFSVVAISTLSLTSLGVFAGCAADPASGEDEVPVEATQDELTSTGRPLVGSWVWVPGDDSAYLDLETIELRANGTYTARVEAGYVNPAVRCVRAPCTLDETGRWNAYRLLGRTRLLLRPAGGKDWRIYTARRVSHTLELGRFGGTTTLTSKQALPSCAAMLCAPGTQCVETTTGGRCEPMAAPGCELIDCMPGMTCEDGPNGGECVPSAPATCAATTCMVGTTCVEGPSGAECVPNDSLAPCRKTGCSGHVCADRDMFTTCEFRPEYACYQAATCERQANGQCGFTPTTELQACLASP